MDRAGARVSPCEKLNNHLLLFDRFRVQFRFIMPGNSDYYRTILGTFFTLIAFMIVMSYASYKLISWDNYKDYDLVQEVLEQ